MSFLQSPWSIPLSIVFVYIFVRGILGVMYETADWAIRVLDGPRQ